MIFQLKCAYMRDSSFALSSSFYLILCNSSKRKFNNTGISNVVGETRGDGSDLIRDTMN